MTPRQAAYELMVQRTLEDSFLPRCNKGILNKVYADVEEAEKENNEAFVECAIKLNLPF